MDSGKSEKWASPASIGAECYQRQLVRFDPATPHPNGCHLEAQFVINKIWMKQATTMWYINDNKTEKRIASIPIFKCGTCRNCVFAGNCARGNQVPGDQAMAGMLGKCGDFSALVLSVTM